MKTIKISAGNSKLGKNTTNISFPPVSTCRKDAPCHNKCYALKSFRMYPNVRNAWGQNLEIYQEDPLGFFKQLSEHINKKKPELFRFMVSGDMPDKNFFMLMCQLCEKTPHTNYLCFTKRYDYVTPEMIPGNLKVILSTWPGMELPKVGPLEDLSYAWISDDERCPTKHIFKCGGSCELCHHECWGCSDDIDIIFDLH